MIKRANKRLAYQISFFLLFALTPVFNIFRLDLNFGHFVVLGYDLKLNLSELVNQQAGTLELAGRILTHALLPIAVSYTHLTLPTICSV